jgi:hypothetical protein
MGIIIITITLFYIKEYFIKYYTILYYKIETKMYILYLILYQKI